MRADINLQSYSPSLDCLLCKHTNGLTESYRCHRGDLNCKGRLHVSLGNIIVIGKHGGHDESPVGLEVSTF